ASLGDLEQFVVDRIRSVGLDPKVLTATLKADPGVDPDELRRALEEFDPVWSLLTTAERGRVIGLLLERVTFDAESGEVQIKFRPGAPRLLHEKNTCSVPGTSPAGGQADQ